MKREINPYAWALLIFYIWLFLEGMLRKWFLPGLATPLFFVKYILAFLLLAFFIINNEKVSRQQFPFIGSFFFLLFYGLLQIGNLTVTTNPVLGVIGCLVYFGFAILMLVVPQALKEQRQIRSVLNILNVIMIPVFLLGIVQYLSPPGALINKYVNEETAMALVGDHVRITTVFSYIAPYSVLLNFIILLLFFQLLQLKKLSLSNWLLIGAFGLGLVNSLMTGSRGLIFMLVIQMSAILLIYALNSDYQKFRRLMLNLCIFLLIGFVSISQSEVGSEAFESFMGRVEDNQDVEGRVYDAFDPFKFMDKAGLVGFGIGVTYPANGRFIIDWWKLPNYWEEESERIVIELGLVGFMIAFVFRAWVFLYSFAVYRKTQNPYLKLLALVITIHLLPSLVFFNQVTFNWMENIIYWTEIGMLVSINQIDTRERTESTRARLSAG